MFLNYVLVADQNKFIHQSEHCNLLFLHLEANIVGDLHNVHYLRIIKQKLYLLPENLDKLSDLNTGFVFVLLLLIDVYWS